MQAQEIVQRIVIKPHCFRQIFRIRHGEPVSMPTRPAWKRMNATDIDERRSLHGLVLAIAPSTVGRFALIAVAFLAVWFAGDVLVVIFAGILFGVHLRAAADWIQEKTGLGARSSFLVLVLAIAVVLGALTWRWGRESSNRQRKSNRRFPPRSYRPANN
jgi:hypothetical protein